MIFCAGRGTRMKSLTVNRPKPMIEVAGRPLVDHALAQLPQDIRRIANLHYLPDTLERYLSSAGIETIFEKDLLETGGGLRNALPHLKSQFVYTMNTDAVWKGPTAFRVLESAWDATRMDALLLTVSKSNARGHLGSGDFDIDENGTISRGSDTIYTGMQIINTKKLDCIREQHFSLNVVWEKLFSQGRIFGVEYPGLWCDVGHPGGIVEAESMLNEG